VETNEGWIVLTHGVGPMRQYCIGAMLLDLIIARLDEPLALRMRKSARANMFPMLSATTPEGAIIHNNEILKIKNHRPPG
jgi:hypothetical protein